VDKASDRYNCGACGNACGKATYCLNSACVCSPSHTACGGACVDLQTDSANCGACGVTCSQSCRAGKCVPR
jgi:hypothetical protein